MAGKSNKGRNRRGAHNTMTASESAVTSDALVNDNSSALESSKADANGVATADESNNAILELTESETENSASQQKQGEASCINVLSYAL